MIINTNTLIASSPFSLIPLMIFLTTHNCEFPFELDLRGTHAELNSIFPSVTGALIMEITYGLDIKSHENEFLQSAQHAMKHADRAMVPGAFLVDTFPIRSLSSLVSQTLGSADDSLQSQICSGMVSWRRIQAFRKGR